MENKNLEKEYLESVLKFVNKEISKEEFSNEKKKFKSCYGAMAFELTKEDIEKVIAPYLEKLKELRKDGETKVKEIKDNILNIRLRKNISKSEKDELLSPLQNELIEAKKIEKEKKNEVDALLKKVLFILKEYGNIYRAHIKAVAKQNKEIAITTYKKKKLEEKERYESSKHNFKKRERLYAYNEHTQKKKEIQNELSDIEANIKGEVHNSYLTLYSMKREILNNNLRVQDKVSYKWENYKFKFKLSSFLMKNSLYIVIILFFVICAIIAEIQGNPLLNSRTLETIFIQSSTKVFFSLGVAGLILLGGTDLSIGRMTGMAATFSCLILSQLSYETNIGVIDMNIPKGIALILAIFVCIFATTLFSSLAGFFTSKFKMHPFITTLSTQLLIYGLMMVCFSQVPAFTMNQSIKNAITGELGWLLPIYAFLVIVIVWFIWNKTKFGKNMYAVGDNKEAASVSGINVFKVTMGVFIMAGILYGLGGFLEGARVGSANPSTALGTELDAIAACVIGGISFSGGKGKVSGAVVGTIIFATLTYCLTYIGLDINYQFIFKGLIILSAVCLDSLKLIKKK